MFCRNCDNPLDDRAVACTKCGVNPRAGTAFCQNCGKPTPTNGVVCISCGVALARADVSAYDPRASNKIVAGVCGILLGSLGVHKFILGYTGAGLIMLLFTILTCGVGAVITHIIGLIEGIVYLSKSDDDFVRTYVLNRREWF